MEKHGILFTCDSSVFLAESKADFVIIDFATRDAAFDYDEKFALEA